jgi:hypothetical protein
MVNMQGATAAELAFRRFGGATTIKQQNNLNSAQGTRILDNNPRRVFWLASVLQGPDVRFMWDHDSTFTGGIQVGARGGYLSMSVDEDGEAVTRELFAMTNSVGSAFVINTIEILRVT